MKRLMVLATVTLAALFLLPSIAAFGQETPSPAAEEETGCQAGELCGSGEREDTIQDNRTDAVETPGNHVRSLITLGLVAAVIGTYLFAALSGRSLFGGRNKKSAGTA